MKFTQTVRLCTTRAVARESERREGAEMHGQKEISVEATDTH